MTHHHRPTPVDHMPLQADAPRPNTQQCAAMVTRLLTCCLLLAVFTRPFRHAARPALVPDPDTMGEETHSHTAPAPLFPTITAFCTAVWEGGVSEEDMLLTFASNTTFTFTSPDGRLMYHGDAAALRFLARIIFPEAICVSPLDTIDERATTDAATPVLRPTQEGGTEA